MTIEEIKAEITAKPNFLNEIATGLKVELSGALKTSGMIIRTAAEDQSFVEARLAAELPAKVATEVEAKFSSKFKTEMDAIDSMVKSITKIDKGAHEKTTDYATRALKEFETSGQKGDPVTIDKLRAAEAKLVENENLHKQALKDLSEKTFKKDVEFAAQAAVDSMNVFIPPHLKTAEDQQAYVQQQKNLMKVGFLATNQARADDTGNITFYGSDGKPVISSTDGKAESAATIMQKQFAAMLIPAGQQGGGTGGDGGSGGQTPGVFKSKDDIHKHLATAGIPVGSPDYMTKFGDLAKESKIEI